MGLDQTALQANDVLSKLEVLVLERLEVLRQLLGLAHLLFELLDMTFLALSEGTLMAGSVSKHGFQSRRLST